MSINYKTVVVLGMDYDEMLRVSGPVRKEEKIDISDFIEELFYNGIQQFSPRYDSPFTENLFGIVIQETDEFSYSEMDFDSYQEKVDVAKKVIYDLFPTANLKLYISTHWY